MVEDSKIEVVRRFWENGQIALESGELDQWLSFVAEDVEWEAVEDAPDAGTYRGRDGLRAYMTDWIGSVDNLSFELVELAEVGDFVVTSQRMTATVRGTDAEMVLTYSTAVLIENGKILRAKEFRERADAIAFAEAGAPDTQR